MVSADGIVEVSGLSFFLSSLHFVLYLLLSCFCMFLCVFPPKRVEFVDVLIPFKRVLLLLIFNIKRNFIQNRDRETITSILANEIYAN